jgi:pimeloyl-ACP methyl ester carboxylesterase
MTGSPYVEQRIAIDQAEISLRDTGGSGFPLLMLHGAGSSKDVFARQFESELANRFRLVAMDLPGHGASSDASDPVRQYSIRGYASAVAQVMGKLNIGRAVVYGWSMGGHIAIELAGSTNLVAGLMLTGAPPVGHGPLAMLRGFHTTWDLLLASKEHFSPRDAERFERLCFGDTSIPAFREAILRTDGRARSAFLKSMMRGDGADQKQVVEKADFPVAIVNGVKEPVARLGYFSSIHYGWLWEDQCHVVGGAGHSPFWEKPAEFNPLLSHFVDDVAANEVARTRQRVRSA